MMLWWPRLHCLCQLPLDNQSPSLASLVRAFYIVMERLIWIGYYRGQASLQSSSSIWCPNWTLGSLTGSVAVDQRQILHLKSAEWSLRIWEFITAFKVHMFPPQWYRPYQKPPCLRQPSWQGAAWLERSRAPCVCERGRGWGTWVIVCSWELWLDSSEWMSGLSRSQVPPISGPSCNSHCVASESEELPFINLADFWWL